MDYLSAKKAAMAGALIKRPHWDNPLRFNAGRLEFVTAVIGDGKTPDRSYAVTKEEANADDWVTA